MENKEEILKLKKLLELDLKIKNRPLSIALTILSRALETNDREGLKIYTKSMKMKLYMKKHQRWERKKRIPPTQYEGKKGESDKKTRLPDQ